MTTSRIYIIRVFRRPFPEARVRLFLQMHDFEFQEWEHGIVSNETYSDLGYDRSNTIYDFIESLVADNNDPTVTYTIRRAGPTFKEAITGYRVNVTR